MSKRIADLIYPEISSDLTTLIEQFPRRSDGNMVVRFAPSPTGMLHLGAVYTCMIDTLISPEIPRTFILRIEDTDQKRFVEGSIEKIVEGLKYFGIQFNEGPLDRIEDHYESVGNYGPYIQTQRQDIYNIATKYLIEQGHAYPCFLTEEEVDQIRKSQELQNKLPGIYGAYSTYRHTNQQDIVNLIQEGKPYVIRLKNPYSLGDKFTFNDLVKGESTMGVPHQDIVLVKSNGIPVYHLASMVDDRLMGVTHIIRSDEWFPNVPIHMYILGLFSDNLPEIAHPGPLLKLDGGSKRKLSKRKDPEADVHELLLAGYEPEAVFNYLANIINSGYEDRWLEDDSRTYHDFNFDLARVSSAGAIVDMIKLNAVSQDTFGRFTDEQIFEKTYKWSELYHPQYCDFLQKNKQICIDAIGIERHDGNDPKRFISYQDVINHCKIFVPSEFMLLTYPEECDTCNTDGMKEFLSVYKDEFNITISKEQWFDQLKQIGVKLGYATTNAEFKEGGYKGKVGDLAMILRIALCKSNKTPDLYETMNVLGSEEVKNRIQAMINFYK